TLYNKPDLVITHLEIEDDFFPYSTSSVDWVPVTYTLENQGPVAVDPSSFRTQVFNITKDGVDQSESFYGWMNPGSQIASLPAGGKGNYTFSISFGNTWSVGVYRFAIMADYQFAVDELDEDNNVSPYIEFEIYDDNVYIPDLQIDSLGIDPGQVEADQTVELSISITISNSGNGSMTATSLAFEVVISDGAVSGIYTAEIAGLDPLESGGSVTFTFIVIYEGNLSPGSYEVTVEVDYLDTVEEILEDNNISPATPFTIIAPTSTSETTSTTETSTDDSTTDTDTTPSDSSEVSPEVSLPGFGLAIVVLSLAIPVILRRKTL
ncbi:MAG: CARDB domain-containing protein, partial [Candidatus Kariarchaeaceae archaeon]